MLICVIQRYFADPGSRAPSSLGFPCGTCSCLPNICSSLPEFVWHRLQSSRGERNRLGLSGGFRQKLSFRKCDGSATTNTKVGVYRTGRNLNRARGDIAWPRDPLVREPLQG